MVCFGENNNKKKKKKEEGQLDEKTPS